MDENIIKDEKIITIQEDKVFNKKFDYCIYALNSSNKENKKMRFGVGSILDSDLNKINIFDFDIENNVFNNVNSIDHFYPANKIMFEPNCNQENELFATSGKYLNLYEINENNEISMKKSFFNELNRDLNAPLTSFDWNLIDKSKIVVSSLDTTCSIYDIKEEKLIKQLIAHDLEVFDISMSPDGNTFASVSADNTLRRFDQRDLSKGDILYESSKCLLKVEWNKTNDNLIAFNKLNENELMILDIRMTMNPCSYLEYHQKPVNSFKWAPYSDIHICTVGDDKNALIWDINKSKEEEITAPILEYENSKEIINLAWNKVYNEYIALSYENELQIIKVN